MEKFLSNFKSYLLVFLIFVFPFFFLPFTQEFFITNKLYFLAAGGLLLILISTLQFLVSKKLVWQKRSFDYLVLLFLTTTALSTLFSSPNKIQALLNPNFGLVMMISLAILYFYLSRNNEAPLRQGFEGRAMKQWNNVVIYSSFFLSIITIIFFFQPFKKPGFTPLGSQLNLVVFLGFLAVYQISRLLKMKQSLIGFLLLTINLLALFLTIYSLLRPLDFTGQALQPQRSFSVVGPPFRLSWYAALEVLKTPQTAFFGVGIDNFSSVFTRVKDLAYNQSSLWQINSFNVSRSAILQIFTETGILGIAAFGLLIFFALKSAIKSFIFLFLYLFICLFIFPPSLIVWFLFFVTLGVMNHAPTEQWNNETMKQSINLSDLPPLYLGIMVVFFGVIGVSGYFLGRSYASEYYFKKSLDGIVKNNLKEVYDNQRQAIILNPHIERFRSNFSRTNFIIANNLLQKEAKEITKQDKQSITQAIQAGIAEAIATTSLNPQKADNWKNLATIYRNIINFAQGSDVWTISAYQRAIILDPQNPFYRVDLGKVYYSLEKHDEAVKFFEQAIRLKPDWPNAQYNYAWASYQKGSYSQAASAMQNVLNLLDPKLDKTDYEKARKDLEEFKKKLPDAR